MDPLIANPVMMTSRRPVIVESLTLTTSLNYTLLQPGIEYTVVWIATFSGGQTTRSPPATFTTLVNCMWCASYHIMYICLLLLFVIAPPNDRPASLILVSYNTTSQLAVFQWNVVYYSNGPIIGYKLYTDDTDPDQLQGATNNIAEVNIGNNSPLTVRVTAVNSAGEGPQTVQSISIDGKDSNLYNDIATKGAFYQFSCSKSISLHDKLYCSTPVLGSTIFFHNGHNELQVGYWLCVPFLILFINIVS